MTATEPAYANSRTGLKHVARSISTDPNSVMSSSATNVTDPVADLRAWLFAIEVDLVATMVRSGYSAGLGATLAGIAAAGAELHHESGIREQDLPLVRTAVPGTSRRLAAAVLLGEASGSLHIRQLADLPSRRSRLVC